MPHIQKILIIEHDDFLRGIIGNLLHKNGLYIINGFCIQSGLKKSKNQKVDVVILGTSCSDYEGKKTISYIQKELGSVKFFIINNKNTEIDFIDSDMQMKTSELSIEKIVQKLS